MTRIHTVFTVVSSAVVVGTVVWGAVLVGSPKTARLQRFDAQRINHLRTISREIQTLCYDSNSPEKLKRELPSSLEELARLARNRRINLIDPESGEHYVYSVKNATTYELCATFSMKLDSDVDVFWNHPAGKHCFQIDVLDSP